MSRVLPTGRTTIVTATQRHARALRTEFGAQAGRAQSSWRTPDVVSWHHWIARLVGAAARMADPPLMLSRTQQLYLWESIVAASGAGNPLQSASLAREACDAFRLAQSFQIPLAAHAPATPEQAAWSHWCSEYAARCRDAGWTDVDAALPWIIDGVGRRQFDLPERIELRGFDQIAPAQRALIAAFADAGVAVANEPTPVARACAQRCAAEDAAAERALMASWVRACLESGCRSVLVVVPNLSQQRAAVLRALDDCLTPSGRFVDRRQVTLCNVSLGLPLSEYPIVRAALDLLSLDLGAEPFDCYTGVLRSPYLRGAEAERGVRAGLDLELRNRAWQWSLRWVRDAAGACPQLRDIFGRLIATLERAPERCPLSVWLQHFAATLTEAGWPGESPLGSAEFQTVDAMRRAFDETGALDVLVGPLSRPAALSRLRSVLAETPFQPESPSLPVQVVGLLEASGLQAEACWLLDASELTLPAPPRPSAFLPLAAQRACGVPQATSEGEVARALARWQRLCAGTSRLVASHARMEGDRPVGPSPITMALPTVDREPERVPAWVRDQIARTLMERVSDDRGVVSAPASSMRGGALLLEDQARCPFRAYARHRLAAAAPKEPAPGLGPTERGVLVHAALAEVWRALCSWQTLHDALPERRAATVQLAVDTVLAACWARLAPAGPAELQALERERLYSRVQAWLDTDLRRPPFTILEVEGGHEAVVGELTLRIRIDRIDRLADGTIALIDYKTGAKRQAVPVQGGRLEAPQLPLYARAAPEPPSAVAYAQVTRSEQRFSALGYTHAFAERERAVAGVKVIAKTEWQDQMARWSDQLAELATEFLSGEARIEPLSGACRHCEFPSLCRIEAATQVLQAEADDVDPAL